ncbi:argininosuccinate lyase [Serratia marcescens]|uniref:ATP-grasp domain-containing protein n=1 Tax=Serratia TaxID=613 RepID=UPI002176F590|nr:ATP-grasp domain-containing protein [Serratia marcescens]CAI1114376.1 argininosuccinate lyase [Serratia marcescens]CAI1138679.1 argininosuccinate lyase [Serratia marcescens]
MNTKTSLPAAFVLTGAFWVICRNSLYLTQLAERNLAILVLTPESYRQQVEEARRNTHSPVSHITDVAYVEGSLDKEASFNPSVIAALQSWRTQYQIVGAFAVGETLVEPTGLVADALGIRTPGLRATRVCRSKYLQRFYLKAFSPDSVMLPPEQRYHIDLATLAYPLIMKPATRHSSSGVLSIETPEQAHRALADYPAHETLLLEQKIVGQEYSVETLSQQGEVIFASATHKVTTDSHANTFVELAHTVPNQDPNSALLLEATKSVLSTLGFSDGIAHAEWRVDHNGRPWLMEIASRTPGDGILPLYNLAYGQPLEPTILRIMLGESASLPPPTRVARQVYLEHPLGILVDVQLDWPGAEIVWLNDNDPWPAIPAGNHDDEPALRAMFIHKQRGERLEPLRSSDDRAVVFFIDARNVAELDQLEQRVRAKITLHVEGQHD